MQSVCSRVPWVIKSGYLCIQEILVVTKSIHSIVLPTIHVSGCEISHLQAVFHLIWDIHVMVKLLTAVIRY